MFQLFARLNHARRLMFLVFAVACCWSFPATKGLAQAVAAVSPEAQSVPEIVVTATKPVKPRRKHAQAKGSQPTTQTAASTDSNSGDGSNSGQPALQQVPSLGKTGTPIGNIPQSIVIVPSKLIKEQGGTSIADVVHDVSGLNIGGTSTYGFFDRFTIRGWTRASIPTASGRRSVLRISRIVNGVARLKGAEGTRFGAARTGPPGGTVNIVLDSAIRDPGLRDFAIHVPGYGISTRSGCSNSVGTRRSPPARRCSRPGHRVDGWLQHADGFRQPRARIMNSARPSASNT